MQDEAVKIMEELMIPIPVEISTWETVPSDKKGSMNLLRSAPFFACVYGMAFGKIINPIQKS